jgi:hypothetical protein
MASWDKIKHDPPHQLKVSPVAAIPHKLCTFCSKLDLSFKLRFAPGKVIASVNDKRDKWAPRGAINQLGYLLKHIIHAFAEANNDAEILMAKWDIQDGFWRLNCQQGEECDFGYALLQEEDKPMKLVVPASLQMGWVELPLYFCAALKTMHDVAIDYIETLIDLLLPHKFDRWAIENRGNVATLGSNKGLIYFVEVYVDDFIAVIIPTSQELVTHVAPGVMHRIHDVFPPRGKEGQDPILEKKLKKREGIFADKKYILGFNFDGTNKTIWLEEGRQATLLTILHQWIRGAKNLWTGDTIC